MSQCRSVQGLCRGWKPSKYVSLVVGSFPIDGEVKRSLSNRFLVIIRTVSSLSAKSSMTEASTSLLL